MDKVEQQAQDAADLAAAQNLQQGLEGAQRPLYITTASQRTGETRYDWPGPEPIIFIGLTDNQLTAAQLETVSALSEEGGVRMCKYISTWRKLSQSRKGRPKTVEDTT
jgi:hypothetical protein